MSRRIVLSGLGAAVPHGLGVDALRDGVMAGRSAVRRIRSYDCSGHHVRIAAEVPATPDVPRRVGPYPVRGRSTVLALAAADEALSHAGLGPNDGVDATEPGDPRGAVSLAQGLGSDAFEDLAARMWRAGASDAGDDAEALDRILARTEGAGAAFADYSLEQCAPILAVRAAAGHCRSAASACASGAQAIAEAAQWILSGEIDWALAGGTSAPVTPSVVPGFAHLNVLSTRNEEPERASRPFDLGRNGFVMGEGAAFCVLETEERARARGAEVLAVLGGWGLSCDAYRLTDPEPEGAGMMESMRRALSMAGIDGREVVYINAHGTSTQMNDSRETLAVKRLFGEHAYRLLISSSKSMFGHLIHSAGAAEAVITVLALQEGLAPPTINLDDPDPECDLDYVPHRARPFDGRFALSNSFGFGGQNASLLFERWDG